jgi:hypothetical protein
MKQMSEFVSKLEGYTDLEVAIIRATKINKVLKAILKLPTIPKEEEFQFKPRSQSLLDKWNKLLATDQVAPVATATPTAVATTNGFSEPAKAEAEKTKVSPAASTEAINGTKESSSVAKVEESAPAVEDPAPEIKELVKVEEGPAPEVEPVKVSLMFFLTSVNLY